MTMHYPGDIGPIHDHFSGWSVWGGREGEDFVHWSEYHLEC